MWTYLTLLLTILVLYIALRAKKEKVALAARDESVEAGMTEPPSLHPVINPNRCIGCGSCVTACPEHDVLGLIRGKAELVNAANCI